MKLNPLNKALLILIAVSLSPACRTGDGGGGGVNMSVKTAPPETVSHKPKTRTNVRHVILAML